MTTKVLWTDDEIKAEEAEIAVLVSKTPFGLLSETVVRQDDQGKVYEVFDGSRRDTKAFLIRWIEENGETA